MTVFRNIACALVLPLLAIALLLAPFGCEQSDVHKASRAAAGIASTLHELEATTENLYRQNLLDKQEAITVVVAISDATVANDKFVDQIAALKDLDPKNRAALANYAGQVVNAVADLNAKLQNTPIKSPEARAKLQYILAGAQAAIETLKAFLANNQAPAPTEQQQVVPALAVSRTHARGAPAVRWTLLHPQRPLVVLARI